MRPRTTTRLLRLARDPLVLGFAVAAGAGFAVWAGWRRGSFAAFLGTIDHTPRVFADFVDVWIPAGRALVAGGPMPAGYYYPPLFALLVAPLGRVDRDVAVAVWAGLEVAAALLLLVVPGVAFFRRSRPLFCVHLGLWVGSVPILHNFKWGQVSVLLALLVWSSLVLYRSGRVGRAAVLLALAISIKFYPAAFLVWFLFRKDLRFVAWTALAACVLLFVVPALVLGAGATADAWAGLLARIAEARTRVAADYDSQFIGHVAARGVAGIRGLLAGTSPRPPPAAVIEVGRWAGLAVCALNLAAVRRLARSGSLYAMVEAFALVFLSLPFVLETSWPHDFVFLPVAQTLALGRLVAVRGPGRLRVGLVWAMLAGSAVLASTFLQQKVGALRHGYSGMLFFADLLVLAAFYLLPRHRSRSGIDFRGEAPAATLAGP